MDQQRLYQQAAEAEGLHRDLSVALVARDRFVIKEIGKTFGSVDPLRIAELSVGDGRMTLAILRALPNVRLTCAEIAESRIDKLCREISGDSTISELMPAFVNCNFDVDFELLHDRDFEAVVALDILEHVLDVFGFVANCHRMLMPGGRLYLRVPNIGYIKHRIGLLCGRLPVTSSWFGPNDDFTAWRSHHGWDGGHLHIFTLPILLRLLKESGFSIVSCKDPGARLEGIRLLWPNLLFSNPLVIARKD